MDERNLLEFVTEGSLVSRPRKIHFYVPGFMHYKTRYHRSSPNDFPTISVTGKACALDCKHCGRSVLETMYPAQTSTQLFDLCDRLKRDGASGCLISGGCSTDGSVPLSGFTEAIRRIKQELNLTVFVHTGIIDPYTAEMLKKAGVDAALIDIIGSDETIKGICKSDARVRDYEESLKALAETGVPFVPHVIVGLDWGKLKGELHALEMIAKHRPSALVIIAFMPIHGTEMGLVEPPKPIDTARVVAAARLMFPKTPLTLGCMRPKGEHRAKTDTLAMAAGVDAIAFPAEEAVEFAENRGYDIAFSSFCCAQAYMDLKTQLTSHATGEQPSR
jgi:uncharacterized radical SAM superfamily protein